MNRLADGATIVSIATLITNHAGTCEWSPPFLFSHPVSAPRSDLITDGLMVHCTGPEGASSPFAKFLKLEVLRNSLPRFEIRRTAPPSLTSSPRN